VGEMRQRRESGCERGSKENWGMWVGDAAEFLGMRACRSAVVRGEDRADRVAQQRRGREERARGERFSAD
jgi:hypothetical protein